MARRSAHRRPLHCDSGALDEGAGGLRAAVGDRLDLPSQLLEQRDERGALLVADCHGALVRASAAVSAVWSSLMAAVTVASVGAVVGNAGLPVSAFTMPWAYVIMAGTGFGSLSDATAR